MKKLIALAMACALGATPAMAAEWADGLSAAKPLPGVREINLSERMGYLYEFPQEKLPASTFCDVLEIYLPREDVMLGTGHGHLYDGEGVEIVDIDFANPDMVELRAQEESELEAKRWGSGVCITMHLPVSLEIGKSYYVLLDLDCFLTADGKISNEAVTDPGRWAPVLNGDFGVNRLYYAAAPAPLTEEELAALEAEAAEATPEPTLAPGVEPTATPEPGADVTTAVQVPGVGDIIHFDLLLGGDAKIAVVYSGNDSAHFDEIEYTQSGTVTGTVTKDELEWGVVFLNEEGEQVGYVDCKRNRQ